MLGRARLATADTAVAAGFVLAAAGEAVALRRGTPGLLAFQLAGAPLLVVLAVRRRRPVLPLAVVCAFAVFGTTVQTALWPHASDGGGVWMFALLLAAYSLGAHARGRTLVLGGLLPLAVALAVDLTTMSGWAAVNGVVFVTAFVGVLPTVVGSMVRVRGDRLAVLERQRDQVVRERQARRESAALAERLRATERLQPALLDGLRALADGAETGADPGDIEQAARELLGRTREEVVALTAPAGPSAERIDGGETVDYLGRLRTAAQPWTVLAAGAVAAGLALESTSVLPSSAPTWVAVVASVAVGVPLSLLWWRPLAALGVAWCTATLFSRLVAPLDGALSGAAMTVAAAFAIGALTTRRRALAGLVLCWVGQAVGVGAADPFGVCVLVLVCWLGGLAVNEGSRLVEQGRANNRLLVGQEAVAQQRAVVEERLRLAREVHDQVGHTLTVVALQAGAARRLASSDPHRAEEVLATIATAARDGLAAMHGEASADLEAVLRRTRGAGLSVSADVAGPDGAGAVPPTMQALVCRVVQEGLTNVLRHAPGADAGVVVRCSDGVVTAEVRNGPPVGPGGEPGSGRGLVGLRERVRAAAGDVHWEATADGGFVVRARLPVPPAGRLPARLPGQQPGHQPGQPPVPSLLEEAGR